MSSFGSQLRAMRLALGLTQREVGELVGRTTNTVARWERGERTPDRNAQVGVIARLLWPEERRAESRQDSRS